MRIVFLVSLALLVAVGGLVACNSNETLLAQAPKTAATQPTPAAPPADGARRIGVAELHDLYAKGEVFIIDTRAEPAYKDEHIKGSISVPAGTVLSRLDDLPRNKMIVAYCT